MTYSPRPSGFRYCSPRQPIYPVSSLFAGCHPLTPVVLAVPNYLDCVTQMLSGSQRDNLSRHESQAKHVIEDGGLRD
jgi:hypothetical protein